MVRELFRKMPHEVALVALHKVRDFALSATEPQQAADAMHIVAAACRRCRDESQEALLQPLLRLIEEDAQGLQGARLSTPIAAHCFAALAGAPRIALHIHAAHARLQTQRLVASKCYDSHPVAESLCNLG